MARRRITVKKQDNMAMTKDIHTGLGLRLCAQLHEIPDMGEACCTWGRRYTAAALCRHKAVAVDIPREEKTGTPLHIPTCAVCGTFVLDSKYIQHDSKGLCRDGVEGAYRQEGRA